MDSYIIRIYQRGEKNASRLVGLVEEVGIEGRKPFRNYDELWEILASPVAVTSLDGENTQRVPAIKRRKKKRKTLS